MDTKYNIIKTYGIILNEHDIKDYDKSLTILTKDLGKITVFSFGSRRQKSKNISKTIIFVFGVFELKLVKNNYVLENIDVKNYFEELKNDINDFSYASYFLEVLNYITFENIEYENHLNLIYYSLLALLNNKIDKNLILNIFRLKCLQYEGIYVESDTLNDNINQTIKYTWDFVLNNNDSKLFKFSLRDDLLIKFNELVENEFNNKINHKFKSLKLIEY